MSHISLRSSSGIERSLGDRALVKGVGGSKNVRRRPSRRERSGSDARRIGIVVRLAGGAAIALGIGGAPVGLYAFATTSERFAIEEIAIDGNVRASSDALSRLSGARVGENIFALDLDQVTGSVEAHPWVRHASVSRSLPGTLEIHVIEHEPRLLVAIDHVYYANGDGEIVKRLAPSEEADLPVVSGLTRDQIETDDGESRALLRSAVQFLDAMSRRVGADRPPAIAGAATGKIGELRVDPALGLSFVEDGVEIVVGHPPFERTIDQLVRVRAALDDRRVEARTIVLGFDERRDRAVARLGGSRPGGSSKMGRAGVALER